MANIGVGADLEPIILVPLRLRPEGRSSRYMQRVDTPNEIDVLHNGSTQHTRAVEVSGYHLVLGPASDGSTNLYGELVGPDDQPTHDISKLTLSADTIEIVGPVRFAQTEVILHARQLRFASADGCTIETTPQDWKARASDYPGTENTAVNGAVGMPGGALTLGVHEIVEPPGAVGARFVLRGGRGQDPGRGCVGDEGASVPPISCSGFPFNWDPCQALRAKGIDPAHVVFIVNHKIPGSAFGLDRWPGDGGDAKPSGRPGLGGQGGNARIANADAIRLVHAPGGESGNPGPAFDGGQGGNPRPAIKVSHNGPGMMGEDARHHASAGLAATVVPAVSATGPAGTIEVVESLGWLHHRLVDATIGHARDLLRANYREDARSILERLRDAIDTHATRDLDYVREHPGHAEAARLTIDALLGRITEGLDFYGNPLGWVPSLSLEVLMVSYAAEIREALRSVFLYYQLSTRSLELGAHRQGLRRAAAMLARDLAKLGQDYVALSNRIPLLEARLRRLAEQTEALQALLLQEEARLVDVARETLESRRDELARIAKLVSLIGVVVTGGAALGKANIGAAILQLVANIETLDGDDKWDQGEHTIEQIKKTFAQLQVARSLLRELSAPPPSSDFDRLIAALKQRSKYYQDLNERLDAAAAEAAATAEELRRTLDELRATGALVGERVHQNVIVREKRLTLHRYEGADALAVMTALVREAQDRLARLQYALVLSFEYDFLRPYRHSVTLDNTMHTVADILRRTPDGELRELGTADTEHLRTIFTEDLQAIAAIGLDVLAHEGGRHSSVMEYVLRDEELAQLSATRRWTFNVSDAGLLYDGEEDLRLRGVAVKELIVSVDGRSSGVVKVIARHGGLSLVQRGDRRYLFKHGRHGNSPFQWEYAYSLSSYDDGVSTRRLGPESLLSAFLSIAGGTPVPVKDLRVFSYPGLVADVEVEIRVPRSAQISIQRMVLQIDYEYAEAVT